MRRVIIVSWLFFAPLAWGGNDSVNNESWRDDYRKKAYNTPISQAEVVAKSPRYDAESDALPLSTAEVVKSARRMLAELVPNAKEWALTEVQIHTVGDPDVFMDRKRTAYFLVCFLPPDAEIDAGAIDQARIAVLLSGEALRPSPERYFAPNVIGVFLDKTTGKGTDTKNPQP